VGEEEDATEYFHIQDAQSVTTLNSNMSGSLLENNSGSKTLYVHWIQTDDPEVRAMIFSRVTFVLSILQGFNCKKQRNNKETNNN
jgi:hypothetical protein